MASLEGKKKTGSVAHTSGKKNPDIQITKDTCKITVSLL